MLIQASSISAQTYTDVSSGEEFETALESGVEGIRLTADFTTLSSDAYSIDSDLNLDLNGHMLLLKSSLNPRVNTVFTIEDTSEEGTGILQCIGKRSMILNAADGEVVINGGLLLSQAYGYAMIDILRGKLTVNGGVLQVADNYYAISNNGETYIKGGTIIGRNGGGAPVYIASEGTTVMSGGAIYAGNNSSWNCFEVAADDDEYGSFEGSLQLPEGVIDGGAIVLDEKWAIPGTRYINYVLPPNVPMVGATHYYYPGESIKLPVPDKYNGLPFAGWSETEGDDSSLLLDVSSSCDRNLQLYGIWKYSWLSDNVKTDLIPKSITPAPGEVTALKEFQLACGALEVYTRDPDDEPEVTAYLLNSATGSKICEANLDHDWYGNITVSLPEEISSPGSYRLVIPAGAFGDEDYEYGNYEEGICNPTLTYDYIIARAEGVGDYAVTDPEDGAVVSSLFRIRITYPEESQVLDNYGDPILLYDASDKEVAWVVAIITDDEDANSLLLELDHTVTDPGVYTLMIPAGALAFDWWDRECTAQCFTYTISNGSGISNIGVEDINGFFFDMNGIRVRNENLLPGFYIHGGRKIIVK